MPESYTEYKFRLSTLSGMPEPGLRERKKQQTRRRISDVATGLFVARGFDNVTVAEIAEAADVSKMTVFNYFPRKEDLFLDRLADQLAELEQIVTRRPEGESVTTALRRYHHELLSEGHPLSGAVEPVRPFFSIVRASPALVNRTREHRQDMEALFRRLLTGEGVDETGARLAAALLAATVSSVFDTAVDAVLAGADHSRVRRDQAAVIDRAFDLLEHGLGPLRS